MEAKIIRKDSGVDVVHDGYSYPFRSEALAGLFVRQIGEGIYTAKELARFERYPVEK